MASLSDIMQVVNRYVPAGFSPQIGMVLGSGLSVLAEQLTNAVHIPYQALPGIETGNVQGHANQLVMGYLNGIPVVMLRGRLHLYEGISPESICHLVRIVKQLGCSIFIVTGAAGSLQLGAGPGELMMLTDHINFQPINPLVGPNNESIGPRFVPMENAYDKNLRACMVRAAERLTITLHNGVYISTMGPSFETPAEIRAFKQWGADAVGMSVVPEVIAARHCGMRVAGIAAITNLAAGLSDEKITHEGTLHFGEIASRKLIKLVPEFISEIIESE